MSRLDNGSSRHAGAVVGNASLSNTTIIDFCMKTDLNDIVPVNSCTPEKKYGKYLQTS